MVSMTEFQKMWVGRVFECLDTGERITIPNNVRPRQFFSFGNSFVDVGDGYYSRAGGHPREGVEE